MQIHKFFGRMQTFRCNFYLNVLVQSCPKQSSVTLGHDLNRMNKIMLSSYKKANLFWLLKFSVESIST